MHPLKLEHLPGAPLQSRIARISTQNVPPKRGKTHSSEKNRILVITSFQEERKGVRSDLDHPSHRQKLHFLIEEKARSNLLACTLSPYLLCQAGVNSNKLLCPHDPKCSIPPLASHLVSCSLMGSMKQIKWSAIFLCLYTGRLPLIPVNGEQYGTV